MYLNFLISSNHNLIEDKELWLKIEDNLSLIETMKP